jgi:hypothetical protein
VNLEDAQKGKISLMDDQNRKFEINAQGEGDSASLEIQSDKGTMRMGADATIQLPHWLPSYPGAVAAGGMSLNEENAKSGACGFKTNDSAETAAAYYENALKNAGFEVQKNTMQAPGQRSMITLSATDNSTQRKASVNVIRNEEGTIINLMFEDN